MENRNSESNCTSGGEGETVMCLWGESPEAAVMQRLLALNFWIVYVIVNMFSKCFECSCHLLAVHCVKWVRHEKKNKKKTQDVYLLLCDFTVSASFQHIFMQMSWYRATSLKPFIPHAAHVRTIYPPIKVCKQHLLYIWHFPTSTMSSLHEDCSSHLMWRWWWLCNKQLQWALDARSEQFSRFSLNNLSDSQWTWQDQSLLVSSCWSGL